MRRITRRTFSTLATATLGAAATGSLATLGCGGTAGAGGERPAGRPPNLLFIMPDQWRAFELGCMGNDFIETPNLDALAAQGVLATNALAACPLCAPNRATLLTGKSPRRHGVLTNDERLGDSQITLAELLRDVGYSTGYIGKWHLDGNEGGKIVVPGFVPRERRQGFDFWAASNHGHFYEEPQYYLDEKLVHEQGYEPEVHTALAERFIRDNQAAPFFLMLSYGPPHEPLEQIPDSVWDRYRGAQIEKRPNVDEGDDPYQVDGRDIITKTEQYYAACTHLDGCIGKLLALLDELALADDTIVVFLSDHGDHLGSHGRGGKSTPFEESIRVPLIIRHPGQLPAGLRSDALISSVDLMPTLLSLTVGVTADDVDGADLAELLRGKSTSGPDAVLLEHHKIANWRAVRTGRWLYAEWTGKLGELPNEPGGWVGETPWLMFDLQADPYQQNNLVKNPGVASKRAELSELLLAMLASTS